MVLKMNIILLPQFTDSYTQYQAKNADFMLICSFRCIALVSAVKEMQSQTECEHAVVHSYAIHILAKTSKVYLLT